MKRVISLLCFMLLFMLGTAYAETFWVGSLYNDNLGIKVPNIMGFDWSSSGSGNCKGLGTSAPLTPGQPFEFRYQSSLTILTNPQGQIVSFPGLTSQFEYTLVAFIPHEVVSQTTVGTTKIDVIKTQAGGQFFLYHDSTPNANVGTGYGFDDGTLVASGTFAADQMSIITINTLTGVGAGSTVLRANVTYVNSDYLDPALPIFTFRFESTLNLPPLDSKTAAYFDGRSGEGNFNAYTVASNDLALKVDGSSKFELSPCTGMIGDVVWNDTNRNGIQDSGEAGIDGVTVKLYDSGNVLLGTTTTGIGPLDQHGYYNFSGLCAGTYRVEVDETTLPPGFFPTASMVGSDRTIDSNGSPTLVTLPANDSSDMTIDFGYQSPCTGKIGDFVWHDMNRDGIQDTGEPGINGVTVNLKNSGGTIIATTSTATNGFYQFTGLCSGDYSVEIDATTLPAGFTPTTSNAPGSTTFDDSNGSPATVNLPTSDSSDNSIDFGYITPCTGSIGDFVWQDSNRNGIQDAGEPGIEGINVSLKNPAGVILATTATTVNGFYQFSGLCAGNYTVTVDASKLPPGFFPTAVNAPGSTTANDSNGSPAAVNLPADDSSDQTIDFGYQSPCSGTIGDFVWNDINKDGIQDANELGISGVIVFLKNPTDNTTYSTTTTDASGHYLFTGLCEGDYKVEVNEATLPTGFVPTISNATGPASDSNGSPALLSLPIDFSDLTIDFGYYMATGKGCTLTWGYWKTHSEYGPAPYDDAWALLINGANTPFFISGQTYYQVLKTEPRGNAYYQLAHQFIAAYLNKLNGADVSVISSLLAQAEELFKQYKPSDKLSCSVRNTFISIASTLDQYNTGEIGPGHCKDTKDDHHDCKDTHHKHDKDGHCVIIPKKCDDHHHAHDKDGNCVLPREHSGGCNDKSHPHDKEGNCVVRSHR